MWALRVKVIPRITYELVLGQVSLGYLTKIDPVIRSYVKKWLFLPHDCPSEDINSKIVDGGLGIPSLKWKASHERFERLRHLKNSSYLVRPVFKSYLDK